jgi:hypothetical protein
MGNSGKKVQSCVKTLVKQTSKSSSTQIGRGKKTTSVECIAYDGRGAKKSGLHTPKEFLEAMKRDTFGMEMCRKAAAQKKTVVHKMTDKKQRFEISFPPCPEDNDVKGWMEYAGARRCSKKQLQAMKRG